MHAQTHTARHMHILSDKVPRTSEWVPCPASRKWRLTSSLSLHVQSRGDSEVGPLSFWGQKSRGQCFEGRCHVYKFIQMHVQSLCICVHSLFKKEMVSIKGYSVITSFLIQCLYTKTPFQTTYCTRESRSIRWHDFSKEQKAMTPADVPPNPQLTGMSALTNHMFKTNMFVF